MSDRYNIGVSEMTASSSNTGTLDAQLPRHTGNLILLSELLANHQAEDAPRQPLLSGTKWLSSAFPGLAYGLLSNVRVALKTNIAEALNRPLSCLQDFVSALTSLTPQRIKPDAASMPMPPTPTPTAISTPKPVPIHGFNASSSHCTTNLLLKDSVPEGLRSGMITISSSSSSTHPKPPQHNCQNPSATSPPQKPLGPTHAANQNTSQEARLTNAMSPLAATTAAMVHEPQAADRWSLYCKQRQPPVPPIPTTTEPLAADRWSLYKQWRRQSPPILSTAPSSSGSSNTCDQQSHPQPEELNQVVPASAAICNTPECSPALGSSLSVLAARRDMSESSSSSGGSSGGSSIGPGMSDPGKGDDGNLSPEVVDEQPQLDDELPEIVVDQADEVSHADPSVVKLSNGSLLWVNQVAGDLLVNQQVTDTDKYMRQRNVGNFILGYARYFTRAGVQPFAHGGVASLYGPLPVVLCNTKGQLHAQEWVLRTEDKVKPYTTAAMFIRDGKVMQYVAWTFQELVLPVQAAIWTPTNSTLDGAVCGRVTQSMRYCLMSLQDLLVKFDYGLPDNALKAVAAHLAVLLWKAAGSGGKTAVVVFNDIKPHNFVLTSDYCLKMIDYSDVQIKGMAPRAVFARSMDWCAAECVVDPLMEGTPATDMAAAGALLMALAMGETAMRTFTPARDPVLGAHVLWPRDQSKWPSLLQDMTYQLEDREPGAADMIIGMAHPDPTQRWTVEHMMCCQFLNNGVNWRTVGGPQEALQAAYQQVAGR